MIRVLSIASECAPLVKTGGLADVAGALPAALGAIGVEMVTLLPGYPQVLAACEGTGTGVLEEDDLWGGPARVLRCRAAGLDLLVLDAPHLFDRPGNIYLGPDGRDWPDNPMRFAALCRVAARIGAEGAGGWMPHILHLHDWQAGLTPLYLGARSARASVGTVLTIHNIAFQGLAPAALRADLGLPEAGFDVEGYEYFGQISALKAGIVYADRLTTVSPTYARELTTPEFGMGLDGVLRSRAQKLRGILNGIDTGSWNPATDPALVAPYKTPRGKGRNKAALRAEFALPAASGPLCVLISRLTEQKGIDLLLQAVPRLLARGGQLALLGSGGAEIETVVRDAAAVMPGFAARIGYDEALSHRMVAGADAILVPSRFEPCGLTQMFGLRYGALPLVALTGGLADTVIDANPAALRAGVATGVQVHPLTVGALADAFDRLCDLYASDHWPVLQRNAMRQEVGWQASARDYAELYAECLPDHG
ncbi:MAG: glycogen synthase GlgA [Qingshengfaniella sp.]